MTATDMVGHNANWNLEPSAKTMEREREALRRKINSHQSHTPLPELIEQVNRHLRAGLTISSWAILARRFAISTGLCGNGWDDICADAASVAGVRGKVLAFMLTWNIWA